MFSSCMSEPLRVLYFVEGHTDIRFLLGLSRRFRLTMMTPGPAYRQSGLAERVAAEHVRVEVVEVPGGRLGFQIRSLGALWRRARAFDVIFSQEMLRGSLNACVVGRLRGVPVVTHTALAPLEYFQCRRERGQLGWLSAWLGSGLIRLLLTLNGRLAHRSLALGPYLLEQTSRYASRVGLYHYYGVDTDYFSPVEPERRAELRRLLELPPDTFLALFSSRVSHEKDPETVLKAARLARGSGLGVTVLNLSGGYAHFLRLAEEMWPGESAKWVMGRPAVHPMRALAPYYQAADVLVQASLAEGAGLSPLEALACGVPVVATAVGGLAALLEEHARLVPRRDAPALAENLLWVASHRAEARATALRGREFVEREWRSERAFQQLREVLEEVARQRGRPIR